MIVHGPAPGCRHRLDRVRVPGQLLTLPQLYIVTFIVGSLAVIFDISWQTLFVSVAERARVRFGECAFQRQPVACAGRRAVDRWRPHPVTERAGHDPFGRGVLRRLCPVPDSSAGTRATDRALDRADPQSQLGTGLSFIFRDSIMRPSGHVGRHPELLQFRLSRALHPVRDHVPQRDARAARACSRSRGHWWRGGRNRGAGNRPTNRPWARLRLRPPGLPGGADPRSADRTVDARYRSFSECCS